MDTPEEPVRLCASPGAIEIHLLGSQSRACGFHLDGDVPVLHPAVEVETGEGEHGVLRLVLGEHRDVCRIRDGYRKRAAALDVVERLLVRLHVLHGSREVFDGVAHPRGCDERRTGERRPREDGEQCGHDEHEADAEPVLAVRPLLRPEFVLLDLVRVPLVLPYRVLDRHGVLLSEESRVQSAGRSDCRERPPWSAHSGTI